MKALRTTLAAVILLVGTMTLHAQSMSIAAMRSNARFLTDRMAYTLGIRNPYLIDEMYRINYDFIWGVNDYLDDVAMGYYYDDYMMVVAARDEALRNLLGYTLWNRLAAYTYFHRPIVFADYHWHFSIYDHDRYGMARFYFHAPRPMVTYAGGHFFRPMPPRPNRMAPPPSVPRQAPTPAPAPQSGMAPRGGAPAPSGAPAQGGTYRGAIPRGNQTQPQGSSAPQPQTSQRGQAQPQGGGYAPRSSSNMRSSSRGNSTTPTRSTATPVRNNSYDTRSAATPARGNSTRSAATPTRSGNTRSGNTRSAGVGYGGRR